MRKSANPTTKIFFQLPETAIHRKHEIAFMTDVCYNKDKLKSCCFTGKEMSEMDSSDQFQELM